MLLERVREVREREREMSEGSEREMLLRRWMKLVEPGG